MNKAALLELADLAERSIKPDRELDVLIHAEIGNRDARWQGNLLLGKSRRAPYDECMLGTIDPGRVARNFTPTWSSPECPHYTSSLDAAMSLVPEGWTWSADASVPNWKVQFKLFNRENKNESGVAATPSLALTAAALRARAQQESKDA